MKTQDEIAELAKRYAYDTMTCPGSPEDIEEVLNMWWENRHHKDVIVWHPFEGYRPDRLFSEFAHFRNSFLNFAKKILEKDSQDNLDIREQKMKKPKFNLGDKVRVSFSRTEKGITFSGFADCYVVAIETNLARTYTYGVANEFPVSPTLKPFPSYDERLLTLLEGVEYVDEDTN